MLGNRFGNRHRMLLLAAAIILVFTATSCVGTVSVGMAVSSPYYGPYGGSVYVGGSVPVHW